MQLKKGHPNLFLQSKLFDQLHSVFDDGTETKFEFCYDNSVLSPLLIYVPVAQIGLITFGIQLKNKHTETNAYMNLLHSLRIYDKGPVPAIYSPINTDIRAKDSNDKLVAALNTIVINKLPEKTGYLPGTSHLI